MGKYLNDSTIKPNTWYKTDKGEEMLYLGHAKQNCGYWNYPECHIYLKRSVLNKHYNTNLNTISVAKMLEDMEELGVRHYCFSQKPRKFVEEMEIHPDMPLFGIVGSFEFV